MTIAQASLMRPFAKRQAPAFGYAHLTQRSGNDGAFTLDGRQYSVHTKEMLSIAQPGVRLGVDEKNQCATFVVTSDTPDRVGDVVEIPGVQTHFFADNPIALLNHGAIVWPIGKWATYDDDICTLVFEPHRVLGTLYYSRRTAEGVQAFVLTQEGIFKSVSVGFNPVAEPVPRNPHEHNPNSLQTGFRFPKIDLIEISLVGIPAQPEATLVRRHLSVGKIAGSPIAPMLRKSLEAIAEPTPVWSNGATLPPEDTMSKKWGKRPKSDKPRVDKGKCAPCEATKATIAAIPQEAKDALQDCVSRKIRILAEEHPDWENDRRVAAAFSICGEKSEGEDKAMGESDGAAGGYAVPESDAKDDTEPYGQDEPGAPQHVLSGKSGEAAETKAMPNVPPVPGADPNMPPDPMAQPQQTQPPAQPAGNPREAISAFMNASSAFVDAAALLFDLVNNTGAQAAVPGAAPGATPPGAMPTELEDDDLDLDLDDDGDTDDMAPDAEGEETPPGGEEEDSDSASGGEDASEEEDEDALKDRYGMGKAGVPAVTKSGKPAMSHRKTLRAAARHFKAIAEHEGELTDMHKAACMGYHHAIKAMCKGMGEEMPADGMGEEEEDEGDEAAGSSAESREPAERPESPATEKAADADTSLDLSAILKGIAPLNAQLDALDSRASALGEKWLNLNGAMN